MTQAATKRFCPRCNGQLLPDGDGEAACLQCGYREDLRMPDRMVEIRDHFAALVEVVQKTVAALQADVAKAEK